MKKLTDILKLITIKDLKKIQTIIQILIEIKEEIFIVELFDLDSEFIIKN